MKKELDPDYFFTRLKISRGFFVDVGANDGQTGSMTADLEKKGWDGILIEPNPFLVSKIKESRKSEVYQNAVGEFEGRLHFYIVDGPGNLHGLSRFNITEDFKKHIQKHKGTIKKEIVMCSTLTSILQKAFNSSHPPIDFLKIDVEGHELSVLKGLNFDLFSPKVIVTEDNTKDKNKSVRHYLREKGYFVIARSGTNNWYVRKNLVSLFFYDFTKAHFTFTRWALKRFFFHLSGKEYKSNYI